VTFSVSRKNCVALVTEKVRYENINRMMSSGSFNNSSCIEPGYFNVEFCLLEITSVS